MTATPVTVACAVWATIAASGGPRVARQQLSGVGTGAATLDVSGDGRFVAFESSVRLSPRDTNRLNDIYVLDRQSGQITLESVAPDGTAAIGSSERPRLSHDGRVLVFTTIATNLIVEGWSQIRPQVVRRDRGTGVIALVSRTPANGTGNGSSQEADVSDDGRVVVFESTATDLVAGPDLNNTGADIYRADTATGTITRVTLTSAGDQLRVGAGSRPRVSGDGRYVVFAFTAELDVPAGAGPAAAAPGERQVFVHDAERHTTRRLSRTRDGRNPNGASYYPAISADGLVVAFVSMATDLAGARRERSQPAVFLHHAASARLVLVGRARGGEADGASSHPAVSADGRYVVFSSKASNLICPHGCDGPDGDLNLLPDIFRVDTASLSVQQVSGVTDGEPWFEPSDGPALDATGRVVAFSSRHPIDDADLHHDDDLFIEELSEGGGRSARHD